MASYCSNRDFMKTVLLSPMPADLPQGGFIEVGEWDGQNHEYEDGVDLILGSYG